MPLALADRCGYAYQMYFRIKKSPSGEVLQLLESYRNKEGKPRNRVVVSLGNARIRKDDWKEISQKVEAILYNITLLIDFELSREAKSWVDAIVKRVGREGRWTRSLTGKAHLIE